MIASPARLLEIDRGLIELLSAISIARAELEVAARARLGATASSACAVRIAAVTTPLAELAFTTPDSGSLRIREKPDVGAAAMCSAFVHANWTWTVG